MICRCSKCKETHEYHQGKVTGGTTGKYLWLKKEINESGILSLHGHRRLCIECMKELLLWMKDRKAHVHVVLSAHPTATTKMATWIKKTAYR
jgi:hypothetical protein